MVWDADPTLLYFAHDYPFGYYIYWMVNLFFPLIWDAILSHIELYARVIFIGVLYCSIDQFVQSMYRVSKTILFLKQSKLLVVESKKLGNMSFRNTLNFIVNCLVVYIGLCNEWIMKKWESPGELKGFYQYFFQLYNLNVLVARVKMRREIAVMIEMKNERYFPCNILLEMLLISQMTSKGSSQLLND